MTKAINKGRRSTLEQRKNNMIKEGTDPEVLKSPCFKGMNMLNVTKHDLTHNFVKKVIDNTPVNEIKESPILGIAPSPLSGQLGYGNAMCPYECLYGSSITINVD